MPILFKKDVVKRRARYWLNPLCGSRYTAFKTVSFKATGRR